MKAEEVGDYMLSGLISLHTKNHENNFSKKILWQSTWNERGNRALTYAQTLFGSKRDC